jgi:hypothetical protein
MKMTKESGGGCTQGKVVTLKEDVRVIQEEWIGVDGEQGNKGEGSGGQVRGGWGRGGKGRWGGGKGGEWGGGREMGGGWVWRGSRVIGGRQNSNTPVTRIHPLYIGNRTLGAST